MASLLKKEEKLLRRLFSKRQQELLGYISHVEKRFESGGTSAENAQLIKDKHNRELLELKKLERKIIGDKGYEQAVNPCEAAK